MPAVGSCSYDRVVAGGEFPFTPKSNVSLRPGQFWAVKLRDGSFAAGVVVHQKSVPSGPGSGRFVAGLFDWWGTRPPTAADLGGASLVSAGHAPVKVITYDGAQILGVRPLPPNAPPHPDMVRNWWFQPASVRWAAERRWVDPPMAPRREIRRVRSPLTADTLQPTRASTGTVLIDRLLATDELAQLDQWLAEHPGFTVRLLGRGRGSVTDLTMVEHLPHLSRLIVDLHHCDSLEPLRQLGPRLVMFRLNATETRLDLSPLEATTGLQTLALHGKHRHPEAISSLVGLRNLTLRATAVADLGLLAPLEHLEALSLQCGRFNDLAPLRRLRALRHLEIERNKSLDDVSVIGDLTTLESLALAFLPAVSHLPPLDGAVALRDVLLETLPGLTDLDALAAAPALTTLWLHGLNNLDLTRLGPLATHPTLKELGVQGRLKKPIKALIDLPEAPPWTDPARAV